MDSPQRRPPQCLRILHLVVPGRTGGVETVIRSLARAQREQGVDAQVGGAVEPEPGEHSFVVGLRADRVPVHVLQIPPRRYLSEVAAWYRLIRRLRPDVVHTHGARADVLGGLAAKVARLPQVSTAHGFTGGDRKNRIYERLQVMAYRRCGAVAAVSEPLRKDLVRRGVPVARTLLVRNAWVAGPDVTSRAAARARLGIPPGPRVLGWVGRLSREKGLDVLLEALPHVTSPDIVLAVLGEGRERAALQEQARRLDLGSRVRWCGAIPDAGLHFSAFDVYVLSSRTEGTPMVLFEAMAVGVPIVATRVGGVPDVLPEGTATLVPPEDPMALGRALQSVLEAPEQANRSALLAQARLAQEFAVEPWVDRYNAIYATVLGVAGSAG